ncbi:MAG: hypothetical protein BWY85_01879 [Firmicutes bacterium ADurb.Bin506]|nr:MAG: hypothetical protein BWY85_01879 [Firmicutes bacterium ADurb.Bin506]
MLCIDTHSLNVLWTQPTSGLGFNSIARRSAVRFPTPGAEANVATSPELTAPTMVSKLRDESIESAVFGPMPFTSHSTRKRSRSSTDSKP